jgi:phage tail-like protein
MPEQHLYPVPAFHFTVDWGSERVGFTEITGLTQEAQVIEYRDGDFKEFSTVKFPGLRKFNNVTLKRGILPNDTEYFAWLTTVEKLSNVSRRDLTVKLLNDKHEPVMAWKLTRAFPVKVEGPALKATGNEVAVESIELAHEGLSVLEK